MFNNDFIILAVAYFIAVMVPGQDFVLVLRNSLSSSRSSGLATALGVASGGAVHISYTIFGFGCLLKESPKAMLAIRFIGGAFLIYLAFKEFKDSKKGVSIEVPEEYNLTNTTNTLTLPHSYTMGIASALLNPFIAMFFISAVSSIVNLNASLDTKFLFIFEVFLIALTWMSFVATVFSNKKVKDQFHKMGHWVGRISGTALFGIALKILFLAG